MLLTPFGGWPPPSGSSGSPAPSFATELSDCRCPPALLASSDWLADLCRHLAHAAGVAIASEHWHAFPALPEAPEGVTGGLLLARSQLAVHTWPDSARVTLALDACSPADALRARPVVRGLLRAFAPGRVQGPPSFPSHSHHHHEIPIQRRLHGASAGAQPRPA